MRRFTANALAGLAIASLALAPLSAFGQGKGHGHGKDNEQGWQDRDRGDDQGWRGRGNQGGHWNPAPPKKNGRHDNRNWNKRRGDDGDDAYRYRNGYPYNDPYGTRAYGGPRYTDPVAHRQSTKNEWRNLAIAGGLVSVLGLLKKDSTLTFAGAAGALYAAYRYEQDRKSQSSLARARAYYFGQPYFYRDGTRYDRRTVYQGGQRYYQFVRG